MDACVDACSIACQALADVSDRIGCLLQPAIRIQLCTHVATALKTPLPLCPQHRAPIALPHCLGWTMQLECCSCSLELNSDVLHLVQAWYSNFLGDGSFAVLVLCFRLALSLLSKFFASFISWLVRDLLHHMLAASGTSVAMI